MENEKLSLLRHEVENLADEYYTIEEKILSKIKNLPGYDKECECDRSDVNAFCVIDDDIISCFCLNCGGEIHR